MTKDRARSKRTTLQRPRRALLVLFACVGIWTALTVGLRAHVVEIENAPGVVVARVHGTGPGDFVLVPGTNLFQLSFNVQNLLADTVITGVGFALPGDLTGFSLVNDPAGFTFSENLANGFGTCQTFDFALATADSASGVGTNQSATFVVTAPSFAFTNLEDIFDFVWVRFEATGPQGRKEIGRGVRPQSLPVVTAGLRRPLGITLSNQKHLIVSEAGTPAPNTGRISIVDPCGHRQTLVEGLPSGINDVGDPSGPAGLFMRGRTLYVAIGEGDSVPRGPVPGSRVPNPTPSSPIFSSVLAFHFNADLERGTAGFALTLEDHWALDRGEKVVLSNGKNDRLRIALVADFPDFTPNPTPTFAQNVRNTNPFDLVIAGGHGYVTDGGQNLVWHVDLSSGTFWPLVTFPAIPNPLFNPPPPAASVGGPFLEAVPTGIASSDHDFLVALFRGAPLPSGASSVERVDRFNGNRAEVVTGLKTAIDVLPVRVRRDTEYLVLQHTSGPGPFLSGPGSLLRVSEAGGPPNVITNRLERPTSMTLDEHRGRLYITELLTGRVVAVAISRKGTFRGRP